MKPPEDARAVVLHLLLSGGDHPTRRFGAAVEAAGLEARDRGLARQLLGGVLRHAIQLDAVYAPYCKRRVQDEAAQWALRLGVLQLFFLSNVPPHAAVHATIQAARPFLQGRTGFVHAVLRAVQRAAHAEDPAQTAFARKRLVVGRRSWLFDQPLFDSHDHDPVAHWAQRLGYPRALAARWFEHLGEEAAVARMRALNEVPPLWLRVNLRRCTRDQALAALRDAGLDVEAAEHPRFLLLRRPGRAVDGLPGFAEGHWSVQDVTSFESLALARPQAGERVLDLCAAPGGKSLALAEATDGGARILACDVDDERLARLAPEAARLGHEVATHPLGAAGDALPEGPFDLIVLDVPCTNTGVLNKRLEARTRFTKDELHRATTVQNLIRKRVQQAWLMPDLAHRPRVLWTTCSLEPEENEEMARRLAKQAGYRLVEERRFEPDGNRAGGYAAMLEPEA